MPSCSTIYPFCSLCFAIVDQNLRIADQLAPAVRNHSPFTQDGTSPLSFQAVLAPPGACPSAAAATAACGGALTVDLRGMPAVAFDPASGSPLGGARVAAAFGAGGVAAGALRRVVSQDGGLLRVEV
jgi:hypothetical protein